MAAPRSDHGRIPAACVYLFTRNDEPVHVGQAPTCAAAWRSSAARRPGHTKATSAFEIASAPPRARGSTWTGPPARLATRDDFVPFFTRAKEAVAELPVRYLEVESRELRTSSRSTAWLALGTTEFATDAA